MKLLLSPDNHLFTLARLGKRLPHGVVALVMSVFFMLITGIGGGMAALTLIVILSVFKGEISAELWQQLSQSGNQQALVKLLLPNTALEQTLMLVLSFGPIFLLLWGWLALVEKRPLWTIGLERRHAGRHYLRGLLVGFLLFAAAVGFSAAWGYITFEQSVQPQGWAALGGILLVFVGWTVQGPAEEALTRGWLMPVLGARYKPLWGVIISSVVFAAFHSFNDNLSLIALLNLFLFGLFAALYALYEGGLWGVFSIHAVWNWAQGNIFGLQVSGSIVPGGTLLDLVEIGPDVITGGPFGPEGGLAVTLVLAVGCAVVWRLSSKKGATELTP